MAVKWLREKYLFLPDYGMARSAAVAVACVKTPSHSRGPGNIRVNVRVSLTTGAVQSAILATDGLLVYLTCLMHVPYIVEI